MPGTVAVAAPSTVLPFSLCTKFSRQFAYDALENSYANGESQRSVTVDAPRRTWTQNKRLKPTAITTLSTFFDASNGSQKCFWFYDIFDPAFTSYDPTGVATGGRYAARIIGGFSLTGDVARSDVPLSLIEVF